MWLGEEKCVWFELYKLRRLAGNRSSRMPFIFCFTCCTVWSVTNHQTALVQTALFFFLVVLFYTGSVMCTCSSGPHLSLNIVKPFICRPALKINLGCPWFLSFKFPEEGRSFSGRPTYNWTSFCNQFSHALLAIRQKFKLKALLPWLNFSDTEGHLVHTSQKQ